ncbi:hypothetical protein ABIB48_002626 [Arthrobacter sp. UYCu511]
MGKRRMNKIHLNGADAEAIAELIGGTLIMVNESDGIATIAGGDTTKLSRLSGQSVTAETL